MSSLKLLLAILTVFFCWVNPGASARAYEVPRNRNVSDTDLLLARAENEYLFLPFPVDYGVWTEQADRLFSGVVERHSPSGSQGKFELWVTGSMSLKAREELERMGILLIENVDQKIELMD